MRSCTANRERNYLNLRAASHLKARLHRLLPLTGSSSCDRNLYSTLGEMLTPFKNIDSNELLDLCNGECLSRRIYVSTHTTVS